MDARRIYVWQQAGWPNFTWDDRALALSLREAHERRGLLLGSLEHAGFPDRRALHVRAITDEVVESSSIEGEIIDRAGARSSIARRLGMPTALEAQDARTEGVVAMTLDAMQNYAIPLSAERLFAWHADLFPADREHRKSGAIGQWRTDEHGPMQVVSGPIGRERVHFEALAARSVPAEMDRFIEWFNDVDGMDGVLLSGLAHLWFLTVHPFFDGNGRIGRAIADMALARSEKRAERYYSLSAQIKRERKAYYHALERAQHGSLDVTEWLSWFVGCYTRSIEEAQRNADSVLRAATFWARRADVPVSERQRDLLVRLLRGFDGSLTVKKWATIAKLSDDAAYRDIADLVRKGFLNAKGGSKNTTYELVDP